MNASVSGLAIERAPEARLCSQEFHNEFSSFSQLLEAIDIEKPFDITNFSRAIKSFTSMLKSSNQIAFKTIISNRELLQKILDLFASPQITEQSSVIDFLLFLNSLFIQDFSVELSVFPALEKLLFLVSQSSAQISSLSQQIICQLCQSISPSPLQSSDIFEKLIAGLDSFSNVQSKVTLMWLLILSGQYQEHSFPLKEQFISHAFEAISTRSFTEGNNFDIIMINSLAIVHHLYQVCQIEVSIPAEIVNRAITFCHHDAIASEAFAFLIFLLDRPEKELLFTEGALNIYSQIQRDCTHDVSATFLYDFFMHAIDAADWIPDSSLISDAIAYFEPNRSHQLVQFQLLFIAKCYQEFVVEDPIGCLLPVIIDEFASGDPGVLCTFGLLFISLLENENAEFIETLNSNKEYFDSIYDTVFDIDTANTELSNFAPYLISLLEKFAKHNHE